VSTWIAMLSQAELISEQRPRFPKAIQDRTPPACAGGSFYTAGFSLPADLDTAPNSAATTGTSAATVRDKLDPE
jgi:hypothetical protein